MGTGRKGHTSTWGVPQQTRKQHGHPLRAHQVEGSSPFWSGGRLWPAFPCCHLLLLPHSSPAYFGLSLVLLGLGSKLYVHLMGLLKKPCKDPLAKVESLNLEVTEEQVQALLAQAASYVNMATTTTKRLLLVED